MRRALSDAELKQRREIAKALLRAISDAGASNEKAALWLGISDRAMSGWARAEHPIRVEAVFACPQLRRHFRRHLCVHDHSSDTEPYPAKKVRR